LVIIELATIMNNIKQTQVVGMAYGPSFTSGIAAFGAYPVHLENGRLYVLEDKRKMEVHADGRVIGVDGMSYQIELTK